MRKLFGVVSFMGSLLKPLLFRGGVWGGGYPLQSAVPVAPTLNPSPEGEGGKKRQASTLLLIKFPNGLAKGGDSVHIFDAGSGFYAGGNIDQRRIGRR